MKKLTKIMVIDDSKSDHLIANFAIEDYDPEIEILSAYDGQEGLDILAAQIENPQAILLDINMPGMDGHTFLKEYDKLDYKCAVIVMLTSSDQEIDKQKCFEHSFVKEYIVKPLECRDIQTIAQSL